MKSFYNGSTLKERFCSKGILRTQNHSGWSKNQKKQSSFTCSSKLTVIFVCPEVACGGQLKIDKLQKLFSNLQILVEYLKIVFQAIFTMGNNFCDLAFASLGSHSKKAFKEIFAPRVEISLLQGLIP